LFFLLRLFLSASATMMSLLLCISTPVRLESTHMPSFNCNYLFKTFTSKESHFLRWTRNWYFNIWILVRHNLVHTRIDASAVTIFLSPCLLKNIQKIEHQLVMEFAGGRTNTLPRRLGMGTKAHSRSTALPYGWWFFYFLLQI
jgi:hypothetical protein